MISNNLPEDEAEFDSLMREVDATLREEGVDIPARPLRGASEVAKALNAEFPLGPIPSDYEPTGFTGIDLAARIFEWYEQRYGERLKIDFRPGRLVISLREDPWELAVPRFYGSHRLVCGPEESSDQVDSTVGSSGEPPQYNVLDSITHLPEGLRDDLTEEECNQIMRGFRTGVENFRLFESVLGCDLVPEALADLETSCHYLLGSNRSPGQSKWASLQLAEKMLKAFIKDSGRTPPHSHKLRKLADTAEVIGLGKVPRPWIDQVQCDASVRYGDTSVSLPEAVVAQHSAMDIAAHAASFFAEDVK